MNLYDILTPHQKEGVKFILNHKKCGLFYEVGKGKTITTITGLVALANRHEISGHILVIAPKPIARSTWIQEFNKWHIPVNMVSLTVDYDPERYKREYAVWKAKMDIIKQVKSTYPDPRDLKKNKGITIDGVHYPPGKFLKPHATTEYAEYLNDPQRPRIDHNLTPEKRLKLYSEIETHAPAVYFINQETVVMLIMWHIKNKKRWPFKTVIIDELHNFKSHSSQKFKFMKAVSPHITRLIGLTGTPIPNGLHDLWAQIYLIDGGARLGRTISEYRSRYFYCSKKDDNGKPILWSVIPGKEPEIYDKIKDIVISATNDPKDLPPITINDIDCYMDEDETALYKTMMKDSVLDVQTAQGEVTVTASNAGILSMRLAQMASGTLYTERGNNSKYVRIHSQKLDMLKYIIDNTASPVIVAYRFESDRIEIMNYFTKLKYGIEVCDGSPDMQARWNNREIPIMLLQPASMSEGLNIQYGGHTIVWYTIPDSLKSWIQTNGRLCRPGQTEPVMIHRLLTKGTIDHRIAKKLHQKIITQEELIEAVELTIKEDGDYEETF